MGKVYGFIAASLDGYIADKDGGVDWLKPYDDVDYGMNAFMAKLDTVVFGRATYDQFPSLDIGWPYAGKRGLVVTSRPLPPLYPDVEAWHDGVEPLVAHLRAQPGGSWILGGAQLQSAVIAAGGLDHLDLFVIPVLLGEGVPLFPKASGPQPNLTLESTERYSNGMVRLSYALS